MPRPKDRGRNPTLLDLLREDQARVLAVLDKHGVYFDPGTYITLSAPLEKAAAYHAVSDKKKFLRDLLGGRRA
ncbi:MAG: hypothetical protein HY552_02225 [Elusimicrobia bacterium]|nr:hypothetical protein [Elusimicrobiota bacterium]